MKARMALLTTLICIGFIAGCNKKDETQITPTDRFGEPVNRNPVGKKSIVFANKPINQCKITYALTQNQPMIFQLADEHYVKMEISICLDDSTSKDKVKEQQDEIIMEYTAYMKSLTKNDFKNIKQVARGVLKKFQAGKYKFIKDLYLINFAIDLP